MTDINSEATGTKGERADDLVSLAEPSPLEGVPASSQDSILNAAHEFEAQLEQMSAWKHQLAQQMELMRRDGIKLLERQKTLALEKKKLHDEREALTADRQEIERLHRELGEETKALRAKEEEIGRARGELQKLEGERARWEEDLQKAQAATQELEQKRAQTTEGLAASETRLKEIQDILNQREAMQQEVAAARETLAGIEAQRAASQSAMHDLSLKEAELQAREKAFAEQEARHLEQDVQLRAALEQLEEQRRQLSEAQRAVMHEREGLGAQQAERSAALEARAAELEGQEAALARKAAELATREEQLRAARLEIEQSQARLLAQQEKLIQEERGLVQKKMGAEDELQARLAAAEKGKKQVEEERAALLKQRRDLEKKLDEMETELSAQLEALAKQTKRLTERRADLETRSEELEREFSQRVARETEALREELTRTQRSYEQRATFLQQQIEQSQAGAVEWQVREAGLRSELQAAGEQIAAAKQELSRMAGDLGDASRQRAEQAKQLADQIVRYESDAAEWQRKLDAAVAEGQAAQSRGAHSDAAAEQLRNEHLQAAMESAAAAKSELEQTRGKLAEAEARQHELEQRLAATEASDTKPATELTRQVEMLEKQRNDLAAQLFSIQDTARRQTEDAMLAKNVLEGELIDLRRRHAALEAERNTWQSKQSGGIDPSLVEKFRAAERSLGAHRDRLLRQARTLRAYRKQVRETKSAQEQGREEMAQQREQLRMRKDNLEQVKRLLEKQEMVMARKLADHNALKTVAAVGIFVIMVLGSTFMGVYKFANPVYRSEAVVQLAPPATEIANSTALQAWLTRQMQFVRSDEVTFTAWKILRAPDDHYGMHDVREEWLASLNKNLSMQVDANARTLSIRYTGPSADGVSQVCNALATAYTTPTGRDGAEDTKSFGVGATILAPATIPSYPAEDNRMMLSLSVVAIVLFASLLLVMMFRHVVARQLREIDQMADEQDLDDIQAELPAEANPA